VEINLLVANKLLQSTRLDLKDQHRLHFVEFFFSIVILPFFTWTYALYPLFTDLQRTNLNHFYYTWFKRVYRYLYWNYLFFAFAYNERSLDDLCYAYWIKYLKRLSKSFDRCLLLEQSCLNVNRPEWFIAHVDVFGRILTVNEDYIRCFTEFPETF
jgi:hypothetical protein